MQVFQLANKLLQGRTHPGNRLFSFFFLNLFSPISEQRSPLKFFIALSPGPLPQRPVTSFIPSSQSYFDLPELRRDVLGFHCINLLVHFSSSFLVTCSAHYHFAFAMGSITSSTLISKLQWRIWHAALQHPSCHAVF